MLLKLVQLLYVVITLQASTGVSTQGETHPDLPFWDPSLPWETRVDDLVSRLTLEEIVPQTIAGLVTPAISRLGIKPYVWYAECMRGQRYTNSTAFPQSLGLAATFSEEILHNVTEAISTETRAHWNSHTARGQYLLNNGLTCLSPVINIMRHPLWGRNQETYGEDPYLSGKMAQNYVWGLQGKDPRYVRAHAGCKHFDVHGGPENIPVSRFSFDAKVSTRDWRMTFLPQFKMCVEAGTFNLMCSYNRINGVPACANKKLLTDILRGEWGFQGYVVSDRSAIERIMTAHHYTNSTVDTVAAAIKAGCNLELESTPIFYKNQLDALKQGKLTEKDIRDNVRPLIYARMRLGEFDPPEMVAYNKINRSAIQSAEHRELAINAAAQSFVLMKNEGNFLPLKKTYERVAVVGPMANDTKQLFGDYASNILSQFTKKVYEGLSTLGHTSSVASGCDNTHCKHYNSTTVMTAVEGADLVIVALGTGQAVEMESNDRSDINLPGLQLQLLIDAVQSGNGVPVVLLLFNACPLDVSWAKVNPGVTAIMECFLPAQSTGEALFRSLTMSEATAAPAGRLPNTWPANIGQVHAITNYSMDGLTYRYFHGDPLYPFGYGLSYTTFKYNPVISISKSAIIQGQDLDVKVTVQNTGKYDSYEVVQLYMSWPVDTLGVPVPKHQLVGFAKPFLKAGDSAIQHFTIKAEQMAIWIDDDTGFGFVPGKMKLYAGGQQPNQKTTVGSNVAEATFTLMKKPPKQKTSAFNLVNKSEFNKQSKNKIFSKL